MEILSVIQRLIHQAIPVNTKNVNTFDMSMTKAKPAFAFEKHSFPHKQKHNANYRFAAQVIRMMAVLIMVMPQLALAQDAPGSSKDNSSPSAAEIVDALIEASAPPAVTVIRTIDTSAYSPPSSDPTSVVFLSDSNQLLLADSEIEEIPALFEGANFFYTTLTGTLTLTATTTSFSDEPTGLAYNPNNQHLFILDDVKNRVYEMQGPGPDGVYGTDDETLTSFLTTGMDSFDPEGLAFGTVDGVDHLFLADGSKNIVFVIQPGPNGTFNGGGDDIITSFETEAFGMTSVEGLAYHPENKTLFIAGTPKVRLAEVSLTGELIRLLDSSAAGAEKPSGLDFGPGPNRHLYMTDRVVDNVNDGKFYEFELPTVTAGNQAPATDAGPNQIINLPAMSTNLAGTVTDDGIPGGVLTHKWTVYNSRSISKTVTFLDNDSLTTSVTFPTAGTYVLRLTADDNELAATDLVTVTVNGAPIVDAGIDQTVAITDGAILDGTVTDDDLPVAGVITKTWSTTSGPGIVVFGDANAEDTTAAFSAPGVYVLNLTADDGGAAISDSVTITATGDALPNQAPIVDAGPNHSIALTETVTLSGSVRDDGQPVPSNLTATWSKQSGPGNVTIADATLLTTTATFDAPGTYVMQLTVSDGELSSSDTTTVIVASGNNNPPTVDAGAAQLVALTAGATLNGTVQDDGNPSGQTLSVMWSKISGPGEVIFATPDQISTKVTFSLPGEYVLLLVADDGDVISEDTITVTVNRAPAVDAGANQSIAAGGTVTLDAAVTDDGFPKPTSLTVTWSKVSGPGNVNFSATNTVDTSASFTAPGVYTLRLSATDGHLTSNDTVLVTVADSGSNQAPTVSAGSDITVTLNSKANLSGTVSDDGLPTSATITVTWSKASGPGDVVFADVNAANTTATFSATGTYVLRLTADDTELDASDTIQVLVLEATEQKLYLPVVLR